MKPNTATASPSRHALTLAARQIFEMRSSALFLFIGVGLCSLPSNARAAFASSPDITATPGSSGMFEISYQVPTGATASTLTNFSFTLSATAVATTTGLTFTAATDLTTDPYVFAGSTTFSGGVANGTSPSATVSDSGSHTVTAGQTFGLAEISYSIAANAIPGSYTLASEGNVTQTGSLMSVFTPGAILIVPEPSTWSLLRAGIAGLGISLRRRSRAQLPA